MTTVIYGQPTAIQIEKGNTIRGWNKLYGLQYPLTKNINKGYFSKEAGESLIKNNLHQLLLTERGSRVMLPDFGANLRKFLFQQMDQQLFIAIREEILHAVTKYAPGIIVKKLSVLPLDQFGSEGLQAIKIKLIVSVREDINTNTEITVNIG